MSVSSPHEPQADQRPIERELHGVRLIDEYAWLKPENWQQVMRDPSRLDPAIRAYLQAENGYCEQALADTGSLQEKLFAEMRGRIKQDDSSVPAPDGPYAYYVRYREEGQHRLLYREPRHSLHSASMQAEAVRRDEQLLLDGDELAHGKAFFQLGATRHSPNHRLLAWLADEAGSEFYTARVRDTETRVDLADVPLRASRFIFVWRKTEIRMHAPAGFLRGLLGCPSYSRGLPRRAHPAPRAAQARLLGQGLCIAGDPNVTPASGMPRHGQFFAAPP